MKKVLMIAYHFPPTAGSSGVQRTLKFTRYLPEFGWEPIMLTVHPRAYVQVNPGQLADIPSGMILRRSFALDSARDLSIGGKYPGFLALPDRWSSWILSAVPAGLQLIRKHRPEAIFSTYPIATAHVIGWLLARLSGLPWIADFRDAMTEDDFPSDPAQWKACRYFETKAVSLARKSVFTTSGTLRMYAERFPDVPADRFEIIENAFDAENFEAAEKNLSPRGAVPPGEPITLLHSGILYPGYRDPRAFFRAIAALSEREDFRKLSFRVVLRSTGHDDLHRASIEEHGITDIVRIEPTISYEKALKEMLEADALLLFQAANCNHQIPAKLYEYFRAKRPILALTDPAGDTAEALRRAGVGCIIPIDDQAAIEAGLPDFLMSVRQGTASRADEDLIDRNTRRIRTESLSRLLNEIVIT